MKDLVIESLKEQHTRRSHVVEHQHNEDLVNKEYEDKIRNINGN